MELNRDSKVGVRNVKTIDEVSIAGAIAQIQIENVDSSDKRTEYPDNLKSLDAHTDAHGFLGKGKGNQTPKAEELKDGEMTSAAEQRDDIGAEDPNLTRRSDGNLAGDADMARLIDANAAARRRQSQKDQVAAMRNAKNHHLASDEDLSAASRFKLLRTAVPEPRKASRADLQTSMQTRKLDNARFTTITDLRSQLGQAALTRENRLDSLERAVKKLDRAHMGYFNGKKLPYSKNQSYKQCLFNPYDAKASTVITV